MGFDHYRKYKLNYCWMKPTLTRDAWSFMEKWHYYKTSHHNHSWGVLSSDLGKSCGQAWHFRGWLRCWRNLELLGCWSSPALGRNWALKCPPSLSTSPQRPNCCLPLMNLPRGRGQAGALVISPGGVSLWGPQRAREGRLTSTNTSFQTGKTVLTLIGLYKNAIIVLFFCQVIDDTMTNQEEEEKNKKKKKEKKAKKETRKKETKEKNKVRNLEF